MEYSSAIKNNDCMKFLGKWMEPEVIILSEVTQSQKNTQWYVLTDKRILAPKAWNTQETIHRNYEAQREGRSEGGHRSPFLEGRTKHSWEEIKGQ